MSESRARQPHFRLLTFGGLRMVDSTGQEVAFPAKALLAACYLLDSAELRQSRDRLARFLWGDTDPAGMRTNLRQTIARIRAREKDLGVEIFDFDQSSVRLRPNVVESDYGAAFVAGAPDPIATLKLLAGRQGGEFLEGITPESAVAREWIDGCRRRLTELAHDLVVQAPTRIRNAEERSLVRDAALRVLEAQPSNDAVRATLVGIHHDGSVAVVPTAYAEVPMSPLARHRDLGLPRPAPAPVLPRLALLSPLLRHSTPHASGIAQALIEDITIGLCALRSVSVVAPHTAARISFGPDRIDAIRRYSIDYVLESRVTDPSSATRSFFAQLIHVANDEIVWADRFELDLLGEIHRQVAVNVVSAIANAVDVHRTVHDDFASDPGAYRLFLAGQKDLRNVDLPSVRRSRRRLKEALRLRPDYSAALSSLARSYFMEWLLTARGEDELLNVAEGHAAKAIATNGELASAHRELGVVRLYQRAFDESIALHDRAEELSPQYANVIASYADTLVQASRPAEGLEKIRRAIELNPLCPDDYFWTAAGASYSTGNYALSLSYIDRMRDRSPADRLSAANWAMLGDAGRARHFVQRTREVHPDFDLDGWLAIVPFREEWQKRHYREGLLAAGY